MNLPLEIERTEYLCHLIENEEDYFGKILDYLPVLNQTITNILDYAQAPENPFVLNEEYVLQVLKDIVYGIEHKDSVFLLDTLRYGLLNIYYYAAIELSDGVKNESTNI